MPSAAPAGTLPGIGAYSARPGADIALKEREEMLLGAGLDVLSQEIGRVGVCRKPIP
jgi:hypothetical protein